MIRFNQTTLILTSLLLSTNLTLAESQPSSVTKTITTKVVTTREVLAEAAKPEVIQVQQYKATNARRAKFNARKTVALHSLNESKNLKKSSSEVLSKDGNTYIVTKSTALKPKAKLGVRTDALRTSVSSVNRPIVKNSKKEMKHHGKTTVETTTTTVTEQIPAQTPIIKNYIINKSAATAPSSTAHTSVAKAPSDLNKKVSIPQLIVGINNYYDGSTVKDPIAGYMPEKDTGYDGGSVEFTTHFVLGYKLSDNISLSINPQLTTTPNYRTYDSKTDTYNSEEGKFMKPVGSFLRFKVGSFYKDEIFSWGGDFRFYPSITDDLKGSVDKTTGEFPDQFHILRTGQNFGWNLSKTVSFELQNIVRFFVRPSAFQAGKNALKVQTLPTLNFQTSDAIQLYLQYSMAAFSQYGGSLSNWNHSQTYLEPGMNIELGKGFSINPFLTLYTGNQVSLDTTKWGANLFWSIL